MRITAFILALAVMLWGCAHGDETEFAPAEQTSILLKDSRFSGIVPEIQAREVFCGHQELAVWAGSSGVAVVFLLRADAGCVVQDSLESETDLVRKFDWLREGELKFEGKARMVEGPHGAIWTLPFKPTIGTASSSSTNSATKASAT